MASCALGCRAVFGASFLAILSCISAAWAADPTPSKSLQLRLPNGVVVSLPKSENVVLSAKEYRELLDRLEKLQDLADAQQAGRPRHCELEGRVEQRGKQAVVRLKTTFKFSTNRPGATLWLGCQRAQAVEAKLDEGKTPLLSAGDDGLRIQVDNPGDHILRLELDVPLTPRGAKGGELGFELGLPGCPITLLSFESPAGVRRYTLSTRVSKPASAGPASVEPDVEQPDAERLALAKGGMALGPVTSLMLAWEDPGRKVDPVRTADADIAVTFGSTEVVTEAKLRLRGSAQEWKFVAPASADVTVGLWPAPGATKPQELPADRTPNVIRPDAGSTVWRLVFREPMAADLQIVVTTRADRPRGADAAKATYPVGPFAALGVRNQTGVIRVRTPPNWKASASLKGDARRETDDTSGELTVRYRYGELAAPPANPPLELTFTQIPGIVQARARNELRLTETAWQLRSEIAISPTRVEVDYVDLELPTSVRALVAEPREIVEEFALLRELGADRRVYRAKLTSPRRTSFSFVLEGDYPHRPDETSASIPLPRLLGVTERATELVVTAQSRFDVRGSYRTWEGAKPGNWETALQREPSDSGVRLRATVDRPVAIAELNWKVAPIHATVRSEADVDLEESFVRVTQRLKVRFSGKPPSRIRLRTDRMPNSLRVNRGSLEPVGAGYDYILPEENPDFDAILQYSIPLPPVEGSLVVPFLLPDGIDCTNIARIWVADSRTATLQETTEWSRLPTEVIPDRSTLPTLVLSAQSASTLPKIILGPRIDSAESTRIERSTIEVRLADNDASYRASFWIRDGDHPVEFVLPTLAKSTEVYVQGKRLTVKSAGSNVNSLRIPRLKAGNGLVRVEFRYRGPKRELLAPLPVSPLESGETTWSIASSPEMLILVPGDAFGSWSPASFLAVLGIGPARVAAGEFQSSTRESDVTVRQSSAGPLQIYECPRHVWLLVWSLSLFGLFSVFGLIGRYWAWSLALFLCIAVLVGTLIWPQPIAQAVFAATPGLAAFVVLRMALRWASSRYRRRVSRTIGFSKSKSSLVRPASVRTGEPTSRRSAVAPVVTPPAS